MKIQVSSSQVLQLSSPNTTGPVSRPTKLHSLFSTELEQLRQVCSEWDTPKNLLIKKLFCEREYARLSVGCQSGEIRCVIVPQKGSAKSVSSFIFQENELTDPEYDNRWRFTAAPIAGVPYLAIWNSKVTSGVNVVASKLVGNELYGPVIFIMLDHELYPTHMSVDTFKKLVMSLL